jgi:hypothetical protein
MIKLNGSCADNHIFFSYVQLFGVTKKNHLSTTRSRGNMSNYIQNPLSHSDWNPKMGDFFSKRVYEEDRLYEKKQLRKKIYISSLISLHMLMLAIVFIYLS